MDVRYWWRIAGNYTVGQRHRLQVTFDAGRLAENVNFAVLLPQADGSLASIASCTASAGSPEDCTASITVPATEVFVTTTSNPVPDRRDETFSLTFSPL